MSKGQSKKDMEIYVNQVCQAFLTPHADVKSIECKYALNGDLFIKLLDAFGSAHYYDATNMSMGNIAQMICQLMSGIPSRRAITDLEALREVDSLFNK